MRREEHRKGGNANLSFALFHINLVAKDDKREVVWVGRARLDEEFVPPAIQCLEAL
jgi:hypothetical protein